MSKHALIIEKYNTLLKNSKVSIQITEWRTAPFKAFIQLSTGITLDEAREVRLLKSRCKSTFLLQYIGQLYSLELVERERLVNTLKVAQNRAIKLAAELTRTPEQKERRREIMLKAGAMRQNTKPNLGVKTWQTGLTKETNATLQRMSDQRKGEGNPMWGRHQTEENKLKKSELIKARIAAGEWTPHVHNSLSRRAYELDAIRYRSSWEVLYKLLNPQFQYEVVRIPYVYDGITRIYIVDFYDVDAKELVEIKPEERTSDPNTQAKFTAARLWAEEHSCIFKVITQQYFINEVHRLPANWADAIPNARVKLRKIFNEASKTRTN